MLLNIRKDRVDYFLNFDNIKIRSCNLNTDQVEILLVIGDSTLFEDGQFRSARVPICRVQDGVGWT